MGAFGTLSLAQAAVSNVGAAQLTVSVDQTVATINGGNVNLRAVPRNVEGRVLVPLQEFAALLGQPVTSVGSGLQIGRLNIDSRLNTAALNGAAQPAGNVATIDGVLYVSMRLLADGLSANLSSDGSGRTLTITALRDGGNPLAPQARFATDKNVYAPGERVIYTEYPCTHISKSCHLYCPSK